VSDFEERRKASEAYNRRWDRIFAMRTVERSKLEAMPDTELTAWQAMYEADSPQYRLVEHILQERLGDRQIAASRRTARWAAIWATISGIAGVIVGWLLSSWHPFQ
jgi:hypothetical protein